MKFLRKACFALTLLLATSTAHSQDTAPINQKYAVGIHLGNLTSGFSFKYRATEKITAQATLGFIGSLSSYGVRGLYAFNTGPFYELYGYGSLALWRFDGFIDDSAVGAGAGGGIEYDLRGLSPTLPPLFVTYELGLNLVNFSNYNGFSSFGTGVALHYRF